MSRTAAMALLGPHRRNPVKQLGNHVLRSPPPFGTWRGSSGACGAVKCLSSPTISWICAGISAVSPIAAFFFLPRRSPRLRPTTDRSTSWSVAKATVQACSLFGCPHRSRSRCPCTPTSRARVRSRCRSPFRSKRRSESPSNCDINPANDEHVPCSIGSTVLRAGGPTTGWQRPNMRPLSASVEPVLCESKRRWARFLSLPSTTDRCSGLPICRNRYPPELVSTV